MITYQIERLSDIKEELMGLLNEHVSEISIISDKANLNHDYYQYLEDTNQHLLITVRDNNEFIGYVSVIITSNPHYAHRLAAYVDAIYVKKSYRTTRVPVKLIAAMEQELKSSKVDDIYFNSKIGLNKLNSTLNKLGYTDVEIISYKRLS